MKYKISNTATKEVLEKHVGLPLKYPKIYTPDPIITGLEESFMPIITSKNSKEIEFGIWGLLPENYDEDWKIFQNTKDTLTTRPDLKNLTSLSNDLSNLKRCAIIVTGFFTNYLYNGQTFPFYVYAKDKKPFYLAAYYNILNDGFITFSIVLTGVTPAIQKIQNLSNYAPKVLTKKECIYWLSNTNSDKEIEEFTKRNSSLEISFHSIGKELYKMGITYKSMLDPIKYTNIPH